MTKIAILGGAFNPPTLAHIQVAEFVLEKGKFDEVWLLPCNKHRFGKNLELNLHRLRMCAIACRKNPKLHVFDYEIRHELSGSTFELVQTLLKDPQLDVDISFIIGADNVNNFINWHNFKKLREIAKFVVVTRSGIELKKKYRWYKNPPHLFLDVEDKITECSSTMARDHFKKHGRSDFLPYLDEEVQRYIQDHCLYVPSEEVQMKETHNRKGWLHGK